jgi:hypothetical protein
LGGPASVDGELGPTPEPSEEERDRYRTEQASRALGIFLPAHACEYTYMKKESGLSQVKALQKAGILLESDVDLVYMQNHMMTGIGLIDKED